MIEDRYYESGVARFFAENYPDADIYYNAKIMGVHSKKYRQVDILMVVGGERVAIECKFYSRKIDLKTVDSFVGFLQDVEIERGIIVTNLGATSSCFRRIANGDIDIDIVLQSELDQFSLGGIIAWQDELAMVFRNPYGWTNFGSVEFSPCLMLPIGSTLEAFGSGKSDFLYIGVADPGMDLNDQFDMEIKHNDQVYPGAKNTKIVQSDDCCIRKSHIVETSKYDVAVCKRVAKGWMMVHGVLSGNNVDWTITAIKRSLSGAFIMDVNYPNEDAADN